MEKRVQKTIQSKKKKKKKEHVLEEGKGRERGKKTCSEMKTKEWAMNFKINKMI